jgi:hypothetical protein
MVTPVSRLPELIAYCNFLAKLVKASNYNAAFGAGGAGLVGSAGGALSSSSIKN